jgi:hypothetical protein
MIGNRIRLVVSTELYRLDRSAFLDNLVAAPYSTVSLPAAADSDDANADPVTDTQPNNGATRVTRHCWTLEEDERLTSAVTSISKKKWRKEFIVNWAAVARLVTGHTQKQCQNRWRDALDPSIDWISRRTGKWSEDEDIKLQDAVQTHGGKNWAPVAALVPGRTIKQCSSR